MDGLQGKVCSVCFILTVRDNSYVPSYCCFNHGWRGIHGKIRLDLKHRYAGYISSSGRVWSNIVVESLQKAIKNHKKQTYTVEGKEKLIEVEV